MKDGLWGNIDGIEKYLGGEGEAHKSLYLFLLYLLSDPKDMVVVWKQLSGQFKKRMSANKLDLGKKLYSFQLQDRESVQAHIQ